MSFTIGHDMQDGLVVEALSDQPLTNALTHLR